MDHYFGFNTPESRKKQRKAALTEIGEKATNFFWDVAPEYGFEMREGQQDMSFEIVDALIHNQHFAVEAGVGIGKSFGYLVPVLLYKKKLNAYTGPRAPYARRISPTPPEGSPTVPK